MGHTIMLPGLAVVEHSFAVPLDHDSRGSDTITVFAREVAAHDGRDRPFLVYFQGGPGFEAGRPDAAPLTSGWMQRALADYRLLLLDQRGTGRSAPIGTLPDLTPAEQAEYLAHFRADAIVRDAEWIRQELGVERWSVLGQSFGGLCVTHYLSRLPGSLAEALITGGLPPLSGHVDEIYALTYARVRERNRRYLERYPEDRERLAAVRERLETDDVRLPGGDRLTWRRFRQLGIGLGMSDGAERLHYILELPVDSPGFRHDAEHGVSFARNPIYAILHEACWGLPGATRWSAHRLLPEEFEHAPLLTGEHVYPWMFDEYRALAPLAEAAELLAERDWPGIYDVDALAANEVPVAAVIYSEDMYVERRFSELTAARIGGARTWLTSEYEHNGLRADGGRVLGRLIDMVRGRV